MLRILMVFSILFAITLRAQEKVDAGLAYNRIWVVCPMIGSGKGNDPKRPLFAPSPAEFQAAVRSARATPSKSRDGILAMQFQVSDDGKTALVEMVAVNADALKPILSSKAAGVKVFQRGKNTQAEVEAEFRKYKANFSFDGFTARVQ